LKTTDILIIGAGQSGLALGYQLHKRRYRFLLVDAAPRVGDNWRNRYDSLVLFTTNELSSLPDLPIPGDPESYTSRKDFGDYLEAYARYFEMPVELNTRIQKLERVNDEFCATSTDGRVYQARVVVVANGPYQKPFVLDFSKNLSNEVLQFTAATYKNASQIPAGSVVVVVGNGSTGRDMAADLSAANTVYLATGKFRLLLPERVFGIPPGTLLTKLGVLTAPSESFIARAFRNLDPFPDREGNVRAMRKKGIRIMPRLIGLQGNTATFANGASVSVNAVLWAVGYKDDSWDWIQIPEAKDEQGNIVHRHGISPVRNLYFLGRPWQTSRMSTLIFGAKKDAELIAMEIDGVLV
jgi:putative flavoprotein involved in K+ transport